MQFSAVPCWIVFLCGVIWRKPSRSDEKSYWNSFSQKLERHEEAFTANLGFKGRVVRASAAAILLLAAILSFRYSVLLGLPLISGGLFVLFEALHGWCVLRACAIRTKL
jgi:hypothetical protein